MVIGIDHLHISMRHKHVPYFEGCVSQGPIFKFKGSAFFSSQGSQLAPQMFKRIIRPHRQGYGGQGPVLINDGPAFPKQTWQPLASLWCDASTMQICDLQACSFQHQRYMGRPVQA